jgi:mannose-6-phosphate isomerase-like protein (cupin superfamily)
MTSPKREFDRRVFFGLAAAVVPMARPGQTGSEARGVYVAAGEDASGEHKALGISTNAFKVTSRHTGGELLVIENMNRGKGGPARHRHLDQDEMFYVVEGDYRIEIGGEHFDLKPGDCILAPRRVPHVWAFVGDAIGRLLISFTPAGQMEAFFREVSKANAMPPQDPRLWQAHGMELLGPPMPV